MKGIKLTQGKVALVDDADFEYLNQWKWYFCSGYAVRSGNRVKGKQTQIKMHRLIMGVQNGMSVDHIDGDGLNNQRANLRLCTQLQNIYNRKKSPNKSSTYKGVSWHKQNKKWAAYIAVNNKLKHLGLYDSEWAAAVAYNVEAIKYFGEYARLNNLSNGEQK